MLNTKKSGLNSGVILPIWHASPMPGRGHINIYIQFNSIQNSLFSTQQHMVYTTMFFAYDVLKSKGSEQKTELVRARSLS